MDRWRGRVALVTGASMGIGAGIVKALAEHGMKVVACARSMDKLQKLADDLCAAGHDVMPMKCDLRSEAEITDMFSRVLERWGGVDVCVNSAGLALESLIIDGDSELWRNMLDVNVLAVCLCTRETVKSMKARGVDDGHIININSMSGHRVGRAHFYSATKFALSALTEGIRWEFRNENSHRRVTQISPGLVRSNFNAVYLGEEAASKMLQERQALEPEDIAEAVIYILSTPPHVQIHEMMVRPTEQIP